MVGRLSPANRERTVDLMLAATAKNFRGVADALLELSAPTADFSYEGFCKEVARLCDRYLDRPIKDLNLADFVGELVRGAARFSLVVNPEFILVGKVLVTLDGVGKDIAPDLDILSEMKPHIHAILMKRYAPERMGLELLRGASSLATVASDLPRQARDVLHDLRSGTLSIQVADGAMPAVIDRLGRRLRASAIASACLFCGTYLLGREPGSWSGRGMVAAGLAVIAVHFAADILSKWGFGTAGVERRAGSGRRVPELAHPRKMEH